MTSNSPPTLLSSFKEKLYDKSSAVVVPESLAINQSLINAISENSVDKVKQSIQMGADVNARTAEGATPLMRAAHLSLLDITKLLVENGADVNAAKGYGFKWTVLIEAADGIGPPPARLDVVKFLVEKGADVHKRDAQGNTATFYARDKETRNFLSDIQQGSVKEWKGGRRRKSYRKKSKKTKKTRRH